MLRHEQNPTVKKHQCHIKKNTAKLSGNKAEALHIAIASLQELSHEFMCYTVCAMCSICLCCR